MLPLGRRSLSNSTIADGKLGAASPRGRSARDDYPSTGELSLACSRFDELARAAGIATSRRELLRAVAMGAGAYMLSRPPLANALVLGRPTHRTARIADACQDSNSISTPCTQFAAYQEQCGVICPNGNRKPWSGCTDPNPSASLADYTPHLARSHGRWCASTRASAHFSVSPVSVSLDWTSSEPVCCPRACAAEWAKVKEKLDQHEEEHRDLMEAAAIRANDAWPQSFHACGRTRAGAKAALTAKVHSAYYETAHAFEAALNEEPPPPGDFTCTSCGTDATCCNHDGSSCCENTCCAGVCCEPTQTCCSDTCCSGECCNGECCGPAEVRCGGVCGPLCHDGSPPDPQTCQCPPPPMFYCNCNNTCYEDEQLCLAECHVTLGCFTGICGYAEEGQC
jgi:hypothetical protein